MDCGLKFFESLERQKPDTHMGTRFLVARQGLVYIFFRFTQKKIMERLGHSLAGGAHSRRILFFESLRIKKANARMGIGFFGGSPGTRTLDPRLKRALLYQLS